MAQQLRDRTAIVTGAGSGINLEFSRKLLENGVNVLCADISLQPAARELILAYTSQPRALYKKTDVTSWLDLEDMFHEAVRSFGSVDIVCPGAGVFEPSWSNFWFPPGTSASKDKVNSNHYATLDINLTHPIRVTQMAMAHFLASNPPPSAANPKTVLLLCSIASQISSLMYPLYHTSKHALVGFVRCFADMENLFGVRVVAVAPGVVKTPLYTDNPAAMKLIDEDRDTWIAPQDVADVMLALAKDKEIPSVIGGENKDQNSGQEPMIPIRGGTILEVLAGTVRDVPAFNNVGPYAGADSGVGATVSRGEAAYFELVDRLRKPDWAKS